MCSQFLIKTRLSDLARHFGIFVPQDNDTDEWDRLISPYQQAPVIAADSSGRLATKMMNFSLIPSWSKERKVKFSSHNARLDSVSEKPTWRKPFLSKHAIVPLTGFVEPIYVRGMAGNMVEFFQPSHALLFAAAIYDEWIDQSSGEVMESFAILTDEPLPFVKTVGHDRSPLFIDKNAVEHWLRPSSENASDHIHYLHKHRFQPELTCKVFRPLKAGWEKRLKA